MGPRAGKPGKCWVNVPSLRDASESFLLLDPSLCVSHRHPNVMHHDACPLPQAHDSRDRDDALEDYAWARALIATLCIRRPSLATF